MKRKSQFKKSIRGLFLLSCFVMLLTACNQQFSSDYKKYTEDNMTLFSLAKTKIPEISSVEIDLQNGDFEIIASDDYYVEYQYYYIKEEPQYELNDGTLRFMTESEHIFSEIELKKRNVVKLYVPVSAKLEELKISISFGDISLNDIFAKWLTIDNSFGDIVASNIYAENYEFVNSSGSLKIKDARLSSGTIESDFGDIVLENLNTPQIGESGQLDTYLEIKLGSGNITMKDITFDAIDLENNFGDVNGETVCVKQFTGNLDSGSFHMELYKTEQLELTNDFGDIDVFLDGEEEEYEISCEADFGRIKIGTATVQEDSVTLNRGAKNKVNLSAMSGDITISIHNLYK